MQANKKQKIQDNIKLAWEQGGRNGITVASVGIGKAKWIIDRCIELTEQFRVGTIMVLTNSTHLRDVGFLKEVERWWDLDEFFDRCDIQCYQTAYKWRDQSFLAVFADEFDTSMTPKYSEFYWNNKWKYFMGLSGTLTQDQYDMAKGIAPMLFQYSVHQAQDEGVINKVELFIHNVPISTIVNLDTGKGFETSEYKNIMYWNSSFDELLEQVKEIGQMIKDIQQNGESGGFTILDVTNLRANLKGKQLYLKRKAMARARQFHGLPSLVTYALKLQEFILNKYPEDKVLMFSKLTKIADQLGPSYHTKNKNSKTIDDFNSGDSRVLSVVSSVKRGVSFVNVKHSITHSLDGSATNFEQREIGRMVRNNPDSVSKIHLLNPVINSRSKGIIQLQPRVWIDKVSKGFFIKEVNIPQWWGK